MLTVQKIFEDFGGPTKLGRAIGVAPSTASEMKRRASIPVDYWPRLVAAAQECGVQGLTYERLVEVHTDQVAS